MDTEERQEKETDSELWKMRDLPTDNWHRYLILIGNEAFTILFPTWGNIKNFVAHSG